MANQKEAEKHNKQSKDEGLILKKDVTWGNTVYQKGKKVFPDRNFEKYLKNNGLVEGFGAKQSSAKAGESEPDVRKRSDKNFGNTKTQ